MAIAYVEDGVERSMRVVFEDGILYLDLCEDDAGAAGRAVKRITVEEQNRMAAEIIAADPARYPGIMQEWAAAILKRGFMRVSDPHWKGKIA